MVRVSAVFPVYERSFHCILFLFLSVQSKERVVRTARVWNELIFCWYSYNCSSALAFLSKSRAAFCLGDECGTTRLGLVWLSTSEELIVWLRWWSWWLWYIGQWFVIDIGMFREQICCSSTMEACAKSGQ